VLGSLAPIVTHPRPPEWFLTFRRSTPTRIVSWACWGEFKHVGAFGYVPGQDLWLFFEPCLNTLECSVFPDSAADPAIRDMTAGALVVKWTPPLLPPRFWNPVNVCAVQVARLVGVRSCALRPSALLRDVLRQGGTIVAGAGIGPVQEAGTAESH